MADELNFQVAAEGFGSYLDGILPSDVAISAGAFSASMQQIRNILAVDFEKFAQVAYSTEVVNTGLNLVNGSDIPTNLNEATLGHDITSIGSGPYGTYTASDFFGCMSGLPYMWSDIQKGIKGLETTKLYNIYNQLFLGVTWEKAVFAIPQPYYYTTVQSYVAPTVSNNPANPNYQPDPGQPNYDPVPYLNGSTGTPTYCATYYSAPGQPARYDWYYTLNISLTDNGGGYGRGTAPNPIVVISPNNVGASVTTTVGRSDLDAQSMGGGTFGRVRATINNGGSYRWLANDTQTNWVNISGSDTDAADPTPPIIPPRDAAWVNSAMPLETIRIQHPPTASLPVTGAGAIATGGTNTSGDVWSRNGLVSSGTAGWPSPMNAVVQGYINQANAEIANIRTLNPYLSRNLNSVYDAAGVQLKIEQRARFTGIPPVAVPRDDFINIYPTALSIFTDSVPYLAQDTRPHMYVQTLEAISNVNTVGGQSVIAMMRQERNAARLQEIGIELDNNIPGEYDPELAKLLISNGTVPVADEGLVVTGINGNVNNPTTTYTIPSVLAVPSPTNNGNTITPTPVGYYDPNTLTFKYTDATSNVGEFSPIQGIINLQNNTINNVNILGPDGNGTGPAMPVTTTRPRPDLPGPGPNNNPGFSGPGFVNPTGSNPSPNSVNPKPNQTPGTLQTGTNNLGTPTGVGGVGGGLGGTGSGNNPAGGNGGGGGTNTGLDGIPIITNLPGTLINNNDLTNQDRFIEPIAVVTVGPKIPIGIGIPIDTGKAKSPGSLAGSTSIIPPNLDGSFIASTLLPSTLSVQEAIDDVIRCNCDCWID